MISFNALPLGMILADQPGLTDQGIRFEPYLGVAQGQVIQVPEGIVARFDYSGAAEFYARGAQVTFTDFHRTLVVHVGLVPNPDLPGFQAHLLLTAYAAGGATVVGTATALVTSGTGYATELRVDAVGPDSILSFVLDSPDAAQSAPIAIRDITVDIPVIMNRDFILECPPGATII